MHKKAELDTRYNTLAAQHDSDVLEVHEAETLYKALLDIQNENENTTRLRGEFKDLQKELSDVLRSVSKPIGYTYTDGNGHHHHYKFMIADGKVVHVPV